AHTTSLTRAGPTSRDVHALQPAIELAHQPLLFLQRRRPPTSTLFPYTTLFRSQLVPATPMATTAKAANTRIRFTSTSQGCWGNRSEEHTSELQSLAYLVCRLLLEKKRDDSRAAKRRGRPPAPPADPPPQPSRRC